MSGYDYLADYIGACADDIIDYDLGVCHFDSPEFKAALEIGRVDLPVRDKSARPKDMTCRNL